MPEQLSGDDEPTEKEASISRKRSHEAPDTQTEPKKRRLNSTSASDVESADSEPKSLTAWPELGAEVPRGLRNRRAELTSYQRDLHKYVDQIQAGAVPYTIVKSMLERVESYIDNTQYIFLSNIAGREASLKDVENQVATAMQEAVNYTEQVMQKVLATETKDCARTRGRFTKAYRLAPNAIGQT